MCAPSIHPPGLRKVGRLLPLLCRRLVLLGPAPSASSISWSLSLPGGSARVEAALTPSLSAGSIQSCPAAGLAVLRGRLTGRRRPEATPSVASLSPLASAVGIAKASIAPAALLQPCSVCGEATALPSTATGAVGDMPASHLACGTGPAVVFRRLAAGCVSAAATVTTVSGPSSKGTFADSWPASS